MKALSLVLVALLCAGALQADVPQTMSYQGVVRDAVGNVVPDASYSLTFAIYDVDAGGSSLWTETQTLPVADGIVNAILGSVVPIALPFDTTYWLGISVEGEAELSPRTELTSAPYAQRAAYADVADDGDWMVDNGDIYRVGGNVGIGLTDPIAKLDVEGTARVTGFQLTTAPTLGHILTSDETGMGSWQPVDPLTLPYSGVVSDTSDAFAVSNMGSGTAVRGHAGGTGEAAFFSIGNPGSSAAVLHTYTDGTGPALHAHAGGGGKAAVFDGDVYVAGGAVGIGLPNPAAGLEIDGPAKMTGFQLTSAPASGYVLTSDATGMGTWEEAPGTIGGAGTTDYVPKFTGTNTIGNSAIYESGGRVSIGTTTSDAMLRMSNAGSLPVLKIEDSSTAFSHYLVELVQTQPMLSTNGFISMDAPDGTDDDAFFIRCTQSHSSGGYSCFRVSTDGSVSCRGGFSSTCDEQYGLYAHTTRDDIAAVGVSGTFAGGTYDGIGVEGRADFNDYYGYGGYFEGGFTGVYAEVTPTGPEEYHGIYGRCNGGTGINYALLGAAGGSGTNYGIYASASGGATNWAGWFEGDVEVTGTLTGPASALKIDHPLDPTELYLRHPAVHSSEMKNVYDGVVVLDSSGEAWVDLPDWFEALNTDFRYQLTAIGAPGPSLYIADKISGNTFRIAGGEPGMEVSWQVTGVRHDVHAEANRVKVEEEKSLEDRGKYVSPEAHGSSPSLAIGRFEESEKLLAKRR